MHFGCILNAKIKRCYSEIQQFSGFKVKHFQSEWLANIIILVWGILTSSFFCCLWKIRYKPNSTLLWSLACLCVCLSACPVVGWSIGQVRLGYMNRNQYWPISSDSILFCLIFCFSFPAPFMQSVCQPASQSFPHVVVVPLCLTEVNIAYVQLTRDVFEFKFSLQHFHSKDAGEVKKICFLQFTIETIRSDRLVMLVCIHVQFIWLLRDIVLKRFCHVLFFNSTQKENY